MAVEVFCPAAHAGRAVAAHPVRHLRLLRRRVVDVTSICGGGVRDDALGGGIRRDVGVPAPGETAVAARGSSLCG